MNLLDFTIYRRCTWKYIVLFSMMMSVFCLFLYTLPVTRIQHYEYLSSRKRSQESPISEGDHLKRVHHTTSNHGTLAELAFAEDVSPVFTVLVNVTVNRRSLPNYYIHGINSPIKADYSRGNIAFVHHTKAGGTTTKAKLRQVCRLTGMGEVLVSNTTTVFHRTLKNGSKTKPTVFYGASSFGICNYLPDRPCSYMTVLRDPYDRIISTYFCCQDGHPDRCGLVEAKDVSITTWAIRKGSHFFNQLLNRLDTCRDVNLHYDEYVTPYQNHTEHIIEYPNKYKKDKYCWFPQKAINKNILTPEQRRALLVYILDHLDQWFAVIGLLEEYHLSLELFSEAYNLPFNTADVLQANRGKSRSKTESSTIEKLKEELRNNEAVREALYEDLMIHEKAKEIFELQREQYYRLKQLSKN